MKRIEVVIHPDKVENVCSALNAAGHPGVTLTHLAEQGGEEKGWVNHVRGISHVVSLLSKVRVELVIQDNDLEIILKVIRDAAWTGEPGCGKIFVHDLADAIRIRTSESGIAAI